MSGNIFSKLFVLGLWGASLDTVDIETPWRNGQSIESRWRCDQIHMVL